MSALAKAGSLTRAATWLGVSRSALSHRIAELEDQLGVKLMAKAGRSVTLTDDAKSLLNAMGDALDRIESAVRPLQRRRNQIRLSTVSSFASQWLIPHLTDFRQRHPDIDIAISTGVRTVDFQAEDLDCAIRHGSGAWAGLEARLLFHETLVPVAAPALIESMPGPFDKGTFENVPLIHARSRYLDWSVWWRQSAMAGDPPEGGLLVETRGLALEAALAGGGVAITDAAYIRRHLRNGALRALSPKPVRLSEGYYLVRRQGGRLSRHLAVFADWLLETARSYRTDDGDVSDGDAGL